MKDTKLYLKSADEIRRHEHCYQYYSIRLLNFLLKMASKSIGKVIIHC